MVSRVPSACGSALPAATSRATRAPARSCGAATGRDGRLRPNPSFSSSVTRAAGLVRIFFSSSCQKRCQEPFQVRPSHRPLRQPHCLHVQIGLSCPIKDPSWAFLRALGQPTPKAKCYHQCTGDDHCSSSFNCGTRYSNYCVGEWIGCRGGKQLDPSQLSPVVFCCANRLNSHENSGEKIKYFSYGKSMQLATCTPESQRRRMEERCSFHWNHGAVSRNK